jgi:cellulose synthase/poly-beta-1,6-N-acetylglucosamine synthase-like glycosyltransferase
MCTMINFVYYGIETALFVLMILSCSYLYLLYFRSRLTIPIINLDQKIYFESPNLGLETNAKYLTVKDKHRKDGEENRNKNGGNNTYSPISNYLYYIDVDHESNNITTSSNTSKENLPFVSIIVPARNEEDYIERCLFSLLRQDYPNFEIIAVDDNSSDNTLSIMENIKNRNNSKTIGLHVNKLKILSLKFKPEKWTGKTWASEKGYLESKGTLLLFADADTNYVDRHLIRKAVHYVQKENLDVLTGIPSSEKLNRFWSKIIVPAWDFVNVLFKIGSADVNDSKSKIAYLMGSFFLIKRDIFVNIGTFESVHDAIQEDKALGVLIKKEGYNMKLVALKEMAYTPCSEDVKALWYGMGRTLAPLVVKNRFKVILNLLVIFFACTLPFLISFIVVTYPNIFEKLFFISNSSQNHFYYLHWTLLNLIPCIMVFIGCSAKCKEYGITPLYSLGIPFASIFVIATCVYNFIPLLVSGKTKPIVLQGRQYIYTKEQSGFYI